MRKAWYVAGVCQIVLLGLVVCGWKYATRDPMRKVFRKLEVGMSKEEVTAIIEKRCEDCELLPDEDFPETIYTIHWNRDQLLDLEQKETNLAWGFSTNRANSSYIWLEYENGKLKDATRTHVYLYYLNMPSGSYWEHLRRGYTVTENECLTESCEKKSLVQGGIITYDEHAAWDRIKNWFRKMSP